MAEENKVESGVVLPPADFTEQLQKEALDRWVLPGVGNGVENAAQQTDYAADQGGNHRQHQRVPDTGKISAGVRLPQLSDVAYQFCKLIHEAPQIAG